MTPNKPSANGIAFRANPQLPADGICFDFHCHSQASDGELTPTELVQRAAAKGVQWLALTDHDTHAGLQEAANACETAGIRLIAGAEWSLQWGNRDLHVLGLNVDPAEEGMCQFEAGQLALREKRAQLMGKKLDKAAGLTGSYDAACQLAGSNTPGRPWFARHLIAEGKVRDMPHAFNRFLKKGQSAFVPTQWPDLVTGIAAIRQAGGIAVLAHPQHYNLTRTKLRRLLTDFCDAGGEGMEVVMPNLTLHQKQRMAECLRDFPLYASGGSDFHSPNQHWLELGKLPAFPEGAKPVWEAWVA